MENKTPVTETSKSKTVAALASTAGLSAFLSYYSNAVLEKKELSNAFTFLTGAMAVATALFIKNEDKDA